MEKWVSELVYNRKLFKTCFAILSV